MAFTIATVEGWTFVVFQALLQRDGASMLDQFELRGECPHGHELLVQDKPAIESACVCVPSPAVIATRDRLLAEWSRRRGRPVSEP